MRWDPLRLDAAPPAPGTTPALFARGAVTRRFDTPGFQGLTCHEVQARSALNRVPAASRVPFRWTVNPYRGCAHACVYCFARRTHAYLDLGTGEDFDRQIVVKVNVAEVLRRELAAPTWRGEHVAMGTNVDCYQRVEGRYRLMRGVLAALRDAANPFSLLTKSALVLRDLDLLCQAAAVTSVSASVSVGFLDETLWRLVEPGTPPPSRRLDVCRRLGDAGIPTGVLMAPILPFLTDDDAALQATVAAIAAAGAAYVVPIVLHLRPGAREWFTAWLHRNHPALVPRYTALYRGGSYAARTYQDDVLRRVGELARRHGLPTGPGRATGDLPAPPPTPPYAEQLALL